MATTNLTKQELTEEQYRAIEEKSLHVLTSGSKALVVNKHIPVSVAFDWRDLEAVSNAQKAQMADQPKSQASVEKADLNLPKEKDKSSFAQSVWGLFHDKTPKTQPTAPTEQPKKTTNKGL